LSAYILVVDDEPDVEALFRQQFRRDLRAQRFVMGVSYNLKEICPHRALGQKL
jgi:hypothetical protein